MFQKNNNSYNLKVSISDTINYLKSSFAFKLIITLVLAITLIPIFLGIISNPMIVALMISSDILTFMGTIFGIHQILSGMYLKQVFYDRSKVLISKISRYLEDVSKQSDIPKDIFEHIIMDKLIRDYDSGIYSNENFDNKVKPECIYQAIRLFSQKEYAKLVETYGENSVRAYLHYLAWVYLKTKEGEDLAKIVEEKIPKDDRENSIRWFFSKFKRIFDKESKSIF